MQTPEAPSSASIGDERRSLFSKMAELIPRMVWLADKNGSRFFFSPRWLGFTGVQHSFAEGDGWLNLVHAHDRHRVSLLLQSAVASKQSFHIEYRLRRRDGVYRQILDSGTPEFTDDGLLRGFLGGCTDLNETVHSAFRASAKDSLNQQPNMDTNFNSPIAIWKLDCDFRIRKTNPAVFQQLESEEDITGKKIWEVVPTISEEMLERVLKEKFRIQVTCSNVLLARRRPSGAPSWIIAAWPVTDSCGNTKALCVSTAEDNTTVRSQNISDVVAALVHDLKSPLIGAERTFEALFKGAAGTLDQDLEKILQILNRGNHSMLEMIQNLIEMQRSDNGDVSLNLEPEDIYELARSTLAELSALASDRAIVLQDNLPAEPEMMYVEGTSLKRVFHNLVSNAIKFTNRGGTITLTSKKAARKLLVSVADTGIGIPVEDQPHLFERYFQGCRKRRGTDGTGLGLYLCKNIVERHGGNISVESKEGEGSTFTLELPTGG
jgi:PAS domain S-box-containing protein